MARWTGIVLALPSSRPDGMASRLPTYLHPVAGRPLVWHATNSFGELTDPPERVLVVSETDLPAELFHDLPFAVEVVVTPQVDEDRPRDLSLLNPDEDACLVVHGAAVVPSSALAQMRQRPTGHWIPGGPAVAAAVHSDAAHLSRLLRLPDPLAAPNGSLDPGASLERTSSALVVEDRFHLSAVTEQVRRQLVRSITASGVSFLLPDSVLVDVDVRIGRDSIVYPGVVLEGATTIGEETVIGPGCRIIDSWVGSGVELRGWNYISHTSIRNRAILEPYVRRGFD